MAGDDGGGGGGGGKTWLWGLAGWMTMVRLFKVFWEQTLVNIRMLPKKMERYLS